MITWNDGYMLSLWMIDYFDWRFGDNEWSLSTWYQKNGGHRYSA